MNTNISVITICYNAEKVIERTMRSVLDQTYIDLEYVILDGKSSDTTAEIIERVLHDYPNRKILFKSEPDNGIYDAMNKAIKMASGDWLNIMNAGDTYTSNNVLEKVFSLEIPQEKTVLYSDHIMSLLNGNKVIINNDLEASVEKFNHQSIIYKRVLHNEYGFYLHRKKLIISDTLFLASIPDEQKKKINDICIADYAEGGASSVACDEIYKQNLCAEFIYKKMPFNQIFIRYYKRRIKNIFLPKKLRTYLKKLLNK